MHAFFQFLTLHFKQSFFTLVTFPFAFSFNWFWPWYDCTFALCASVAKTKTQVTYLRKKKAKVKWNLVMASVGELKMDENADQE